MARILPVVHCMALAAMMLLGLPVAQAQIAVVSPSYIDFGEIKMGAQVTVPVQVRNLTAVPLSLAGGGFNTANGFSGSTGSCTSPLPAYATCAMNFSFRPQAATGTFENSTLLSLNGSAGIFTAAIAVRGTGGESLVQVTPRSIDFGEELIGQQVSVPVVITNTHSATVQFAGGGIGGPFTASQNCSAGLEPGASCRFTYRFTPGQIDEVSGNTSFTVSSTGPALSQSYAIQLRGRGRTAAGRYHVAPVTLDFGNIKIGDAVVSQVTSINRTAEPMMRSGGGFNDDDNAFSSSISAVPACAGGGLPPAVACPSNYQFLPRERRDHAAATVIGYTQAGFYEQVPLAFTGTGVGTLARVWPVAVDFGDIEPGTLVTMPVTILNTSPVTLNDLQVVNVTGAFSLTTNCGPSLAADASCTVTYRFQPGAINNFMAISSISYQGNGASESTQITLSGTSGSAIFVDGFEQ